VEGGKKDSASNQGSSGMTRDLAASLDPAEERGDRHVRSSRSRKVSYAQLASANLRKLLTDSESVTSAHRQDNESDNVIGVGFAVLVYRAARSPRIRKMAHLEKRVRPGEFFPEKGEGRSECIVESRFRAEETDGKPFVLLPFAKGLLVCSEENVD